MSDDGWGDDDGGGWGTTATPVQSSGDVGNVGGGGGSGCRKCGEEGHFARDCPSGGGGGSGDNKCRNCRQEGHMANDCPNPEVCRKCRKEGHMVAECPEPDKCFNCRQEGHKTADCPEPAKCRRCKSEDHQVADCPKPQVCNRCGEEGHMARECTGEEKTRQWVDDEGNTRESYVPKADMQENELFNLGIRSGINFSKYANIPVSVTSQNEDEKPPGKIDNFAKAGLRPILMENIGKSNYTVPTPVQKNAIPIIMASRDLMACAQTGSGKTAAFLLPILHFLISTDADSHPGASTCCPQAVIMTPTRELAIQIYHEARKFAQGSMIKAAVVYGGTSTGYQSRKLMDGCNILIATPGRLMDYVDKDRISFREVKFFVLDEADRMLDMGFMPEIQKCVNEKDMPPKESRQTLMFSATFPDEIQTAAQEFLNDYFFLTLGVVGGVCDDVKPNFVQVDQNDKREKLEELMNDPSRNPTELTLIFVKTKKMADFLASSLCQDGLPSTSIHGDRLQREREEALYDFRTGSKPILVATAVAARGLDIPNVAHVINYDMPEDIDEYVHRIGRSGRVGNIGKATSFVEAESDGEVCGQIVQLYKGTTIVVPEWLSGMAISSGGGEGNNQGTSGGCDDEGDDDDWG